jgi:hypothetical protein
MKRGEKPMHARRSKIAAVTAIALLMSVLVLPAAAAPTKNQGLVVEGWKVYGNQVILSVTNLSSQSTAGTVNVHAIVVGLPMSSDVSVSLAAGQSQNVTATFWGPVTGVIECIVDDSSPVT